MQAVKAGSVTEEECIAVLSNLQEENITGFVENFHDLLLLVFQRQTPLLPGHAGTRLVGGSDGKRLVVHRAAPSPILQAAGYILLSESTWLGAAWRQGT